MKPLLQTCCPHRDLRRDDPGAPHGGRRARRERSRGIGHALHRCIGTLLLGSLAPLAALGAEGLSVPTAEQLWPQWQLRIGLQAAEPLVTPMASMAPVAPLLPMAQQAEAGALARGLRGTTLLGEVSFATPWLRSFHAAGGLRLDAQGSEPIQAQPYLGLGYRGGLWLQGLQLSADLGIVAERPAAAAGLGRALLGNQGWQSAARELRLAPVLQLGVRYAF